MAPANRSHDPRKKAKGGIVTGSIICGVEDSEAAKAAGRVARRLSSRLGLRLVFVRVVEPGSPDRMISAIAERLQRLSSLCTDVDAGAGWLVDVGDPVDRIVAAAVDEDARLVVVGSTGPRSSMLDSVSAEVSRRAPCPVLVVPSVASGLAENERVEAVVRSNLASGRQGPLTDRANVRGGIVRFGLGAGLNGR
jgi:nucleotide-binding universal stress UspA family protein